MIILEVIVMAMEVYILLKLHFVGTFSFLNEVKNHLGLEKNILSQNELYSLTYSNRKAKTVADLLYKHSTVYLDRKYEKYLDFCRHYKEL